MRRVLLVLAGAFAAAALAAPAAFAGNPHFIKSATSAALSGSQLTCTFKEAGLESGSVENVKLTLPDDVALVEALLRHRAGGAA